MSYKPSITFYGEQGQPSTDNAGPEVLQQDLVKLARMFDPSATHVGGQQGGISIDNLNFDKDTTADYSKIPATSRYVGDSTTVKGQLDNDVATIALKESLSNKRTAFQATPDNTHYPSEKLVKDSLDTKVDKISGKGLSTNDYTNEDKAKVTGAEQTSNKVTSISSASTDAQYPSAKCIYDTVAIPTLTFTQAQVISADPIILQLTDEQYAIAAANPFIKVDSTAFGGVKAGLVKYGETATIISFSTTKGESEAKKIINGNFTINKSTKRGYAFDVVLKDLPNQTGNAGKFLTTNGNNASWANVSSATWGSITGTLSNQTDLATALSGKMPNPTNSGTQGYALFSDGEGGSAWYDPSDPNKMNVSNPVCTGSLSMHRSPAYSVGASSVALCSGCTATGTASLAEGGSTSANGTGSHTEGVGTYTSSDAIAAHAEGYSTSAMSQYQHVQGSYNVTDSASKYLDIVGCGESPLSPRNAETLDWNGNLWTRTDVMCGGTDMDSPAHVLSKKHNAFTFTSDGNGHVTYTEV